MVVTLNTLLTSQKLLLNQHFRRVESVLKDSNLRGIAENHTKFLKEEFHCGFNLFMLISDTYKRENFHSDILKALLDPTERHNEGDKYLMLFLSFLNDTNENNLFIDLSNYSNAEVLRETGRIDILIKDRNSGHAIIVENKINKAADQFRQLPRYVEKLEEQGTQVDAIIYLVLNYHLTPTTFGWKPEDYGKVSPKLISIIATNNSSNDLINGWLKPCIDATVNSEAGFVLKQYETLIKLIGLRAMDNQIMEKFYEQMQVDSNYDIALSIKNMLSDLSIYRLERIVESFRNSCAPFDRTWNWQNKAAVIDRARYGDNVYAIDIYAETDCYKFQFFLRDTKEGTSVSNSLHEILRRLDLVADFNLVNGRMQKLFKFPSDEEALYAYIKMFCEKFLSLLGGGRSDTEF